MKSLLLATAGALIFAIPAHAQSDCVVDRYGQDFSAYDTNNDCAIDQAEFGAIFERDRDMLARYDDDADGVLTEDELGTTVFGEYDANRDRMMDAQEFGLFWGEGVEYRTRLEESAAERRGRD